jgi:hypothetical protein
MSLHPQLSCSLCLQKKKKLFSTKHRIVYQLKYSLEKIIKLAGFHEISLEKNSLPLFSPSKIQILFLNKNFRMCLLNFFKKIHFEIFILRQKWNSRRKKRNVEKGPFPLGQ